MGSKTQQDLVNSKTYMNTMSNKPNYYAWYEKRNAKKWIIELMFHTAKLKDNYMKKRTQKKG